MIIFFLSVVFCFLALLALLPLIAVVLGSYPGNFFQKLQCFFVEHSGIVISLATLLLVSALGLLATHLANVSAERRENQNRKLAQELKLVDFRQAWINDLRSAFVRYHGMLHDVDTEEVDTKEFAIAVSEILLRMDVDDQDYEELYELHKNLLEQRLENEELPKVMKSIELGQRILKREWERVKSDLNKAGSANA